MNNRFQTVFMLASLVAVTSCAAIESKNMGSSRFEIPKKSPVADQGLALPEPRKAPSGVITLDDALRAAMERHPGLAAAWHEIKAREGNARQAGVLPNPSLSGEFEEFGGSGDYSGTHVMSAKIGISQEIPLGGKRTKRVKAADVETELSVLARSAEIIALRSNVKKRFIRVHILQEQLKLAEAKLKLVRTSSDAVTKRVSAGEASPLDQTKIAVQLVSSGVEVERIKRQLDAARYALASSWAGEKPKFSAVEAKYPLITDLPSEDALLALLDEHPNYRILEKKVSLAAAALDLAKSEAWMDIELGGGIQQFEETNDHAYFFEVSIPIPLFDRNQGGIQAAREALVVATKRQESGKLALKKTLLETVKRHGSIKYAFLTMHNTVLPAAEKAYGSVQKAYMVGEQGYLELLDAQNTLLEVRQERLKLLAELQQLEAELEEFMTYSALWGKNKKQP